VHRDVCVLAPLQHIQKRVQRHAAVADHRRAAPLEERGRKRVRAVERPDELAHGDGAGDEHRELIVPDASPEHVLAGGDVHLAHVLQRELRDHVGRETPAHVARRQRRARRREAVRGPRVRRVIKRAVVHEPLALVHEPEVPGGVGVLVFVFAFALCAAHRAVGAETGSPEPVVRRAEKAVARRRTVARRLLFARRPAPPPGENTSLFSLHSRHRLTAWRSRLG
jgi:hypothetical protein